MRMARCTPSVTHRRRAGRPRARVPRGVARDRRPRPVRRGRGDGRAAVREASGAGGPGLARLHVPRSPAAGRTAASTCAGCRSCSAMAKKRNADPAAGRARPPRGRQRPPPAARRPRSRARANACARGAGVLVRVRGRVGQARARAVRDLRAARGRRAAADQPRAALRRRRLQRRAPARPRRPRPRARELRDRPARRRLPVRARGAAASRRGSWSRSGRRSTRGSTSAASSTRTSTTTSWRWCSLLACFVPWQPPARGRARDQIRTWAVRLILVQLGDHVPVGRDLEARRRWLDGRTLATQLTGSLRAADRGQRRVPGGRPVHRADRARRSP